MDKFHSSTLKIGIFICWPSGPNRRLRLIYKIACIFCTTNTETHVSLNGSTEKSSLLSSDCISTFTAIKSSQVRQSLNES